MQFSFSGCLFQVISTIYKLLAEHTVDGNNHVLTNLIITTIYFRTKKSLYARSLRLSLSSAPKEVSVFCPLWVPVALARKIEESLEVPD